MPSPDSEPGRSLSLERTFQRAAYHSTGIARPRSRTRSGEIAPSTCPWPCGIRTGTSFTASTRFTNGMRRPRGSTPNWPKRIVGLLPSMPSWNGPAEDLRLAGETLEETVAVRTAELAESNERLRTEAGARERLGEDLRQAQKMEAVGQLTGGIAHDFNNLLTGIVGSLYMMRRRIAQKRYDNLENYIEIAMGSADRAASLTHRLLAFSRRQPLDPRITDVNGLLAGMEDLVRRSINETIILNIVPCEAEATTLCDAHQLENAILNLAINARDAMPGGGRLTITTTIDDPVGPGGIRSVVIAVADTGTGTAPDVVARAFDPFFTTKPLGKGTGLGRSMIYGFARQSRGEASIESSVGVGTTIRIRLPFVSGSVADLGSCSADAANFTGHGERILVVEDDDAPITGS